MKVILLIALMTLLPVMATAQEEKTLVSEDWDETSATETWYDDLVVWEVDWVQTYSDGSTVRKTFQNCDERSLKVLSDWVIREDEHVNGREFATTAPTVSETVSSWLDQVKTVDGARFEWVRDIREFSTTVAYGDTMKYNRYKAIDPSNCSVTYKGKVHSFVHHQSVSAVNTSTDKLSVANKMCKGTYGVASYKSKLSYTVGDNTKDVYAFGICLQHNDVAFFPHEWGELKEVYQTKVKSESGKEFVYIWSLHFSKGYILPVVMRDGASNPEYTFEYVLKTDNNSYNSAAYNSKTGHWDNAIVGKGSNIDRFDLKIEDGRLYAKISETDKNLGSWSSCRDGRFEGFDMTIFCDSGGAVEYNGNKVSYELSTFTKGTTFSVDSHTPIPVNIYIKPESGYRLKRVIRGMGELKHNPYTSSYYFSDGADASGYLDGDKLSFQNVCSNISLYFQFEKIPKAETSFYCKIENILYHVNFPERTATVYSPSSPSSITEANILDKFELSGSMILERQNLPQDKWMEVGNEILQPTATYSFKVTGIEDNAFSKCSKLKSAIIPDGVISIGENVFANCLLLTDVTIGNSVESIGKNMFFKCPNLKSVVIPNSVKSIGESAFSNCTAMTNLTIGNGVESIGKKAFLSCYNLKSVEIPNSVTSIDDNAFNDCFGLTAITISNSVRSIGEAAFYGCTALTDLTIGNGVESIGKSAFASCGNLTSVDIPNSVTSIDDKAFYECSGLTTIAIPNNVTSIGAYVFYDCKSLTDVTIGSGVKSIGEYAFSCASQELNVTSLIQEPFTVSSDAFYPQTTLTVPEGTLDAYKNTESWCYFSNIYEVGGGLNEGDYFESDDGVMYKVISVIPKQVEVSSRDGDPTVDYERTGSLTIPSSVKAVDGKTYTVTAIGTSAFSWVALTSIVLPQSITSFGDYVFEGAELDSLTVKWTTPPSITSVWSFEEFNPSTTTLYVPKGSEAAYMGADPWKNFKKIVGVDLPEEPVALTDITLPATLVVRLGGTLQLSPTFSPANAANKGVTWKSSDTRVATIGADGTVSGLVAGTTTITCTSTADTSIYATCIVTVSESGIPGDANGDGVVDEKDIVEIVNFLMGKPSEKFNKIAADANGDNVVNAADIVTIVNILKKE
jgi:hypothetical protein